jgi:hypothetical protein
MSGADPQVRGRPTGRPVFNEDFAVLNELRLYDGLPEVTA